MLCEENNGKGFVIFTTKLNLQTLCSADTFLMAGTFKSCPKPFYQLYTILAYINTFYIPLVFAVLPDKTQSTYETLLHYLLTHRDVTGLQCEPLNLLRKTCLTCLMMPGAVSLPITWLTISLPQTAISRRHSGRMPVTTNGAESYHGHLNSKR